MSHRSRIRWFRRLAVGLAFAAFAAPAAARPDAQGGAVQPVDPYLTDVFVRPGEAQPGPDGGVAVGASAVDAAAVRQAQPADSGWSPQRSDAVALGIGILGLALGLGLAVGYARRPRIAGL